MAAKDKTDVAVKEESAAETVAPKRGGFTVPDSTRNAKLLSAIQNDTTPMQTIGDIETLFGGALISWDIISPSYEVVDKDTMIGVPFVAIAWRFNESSKYTVMNPEGSARIPAWFVSVLVAPYDEDGTLGDKVILNDGSTGIYKQLEQLSDTHGIYGGLNISKGLRVSEYDYEIDGEVAGQARTFYFA